MHSDLAQEERDKVMLDFKNNKLDILVATDIVARGIDIDQIGLVINYDVPRDPEDYIHRIGRTARANADGRAMTFVAEDDQVRFQRIERFLGYEVRKEAVPEELGETPQYKPMLPDKGRNRNRGRYRNHKRRGQTSQPHTPQEGKPQESKNNRNHRNRRKQAKGGNGKESNNNKPQ